jgi:hypothetical protein
MRKLIVAAGGGLLASIGTMLIGSNAPGYWLRGLVGSAKHPTGLDLYVFDHYFVVDPALFLVNFITFVGVLYALVWLGSRAVPPHGHRNPDA